MAIGPSPTLRFDSEVVSPTKLSQILEQEQLAPSATLSEEQIGRPPQRTLTRYKFDSKQLPAARWAQAVQDTVKALPHYVITAQVPDEKTRFVRKEERNAIIVLHLQSNKNPLKFDPFQHSYAIKDSHKWETQGLCPLCNYNENGEKRTRPTARYTTQSQSFSRVKIADNGRVSDQTLATLPSGLQLHFATVHSYIPQTLNLNDIGLIFQARNPDNSKDFKSPAITSTKSSYHKGEEVRHDVVTFLQFKGMAPSLLSMTGKIYKVKSRFSIGKAQTERTSCYRVATATLVSLTIAGLAWLASGDNLQRTLVSLGLAQQERSFSNCYGYC